MTQAGNGDMADRDTFVVGVVTEAVDRQLRKAIERGDLSEESAALLGWGILHEIADRLERTDP